MIYEVDLDLYRDFVNLKEKLDDIMSKKHILNDRISSIHPNQKIHNLETF